MSRIVEALVRRIRIGAFGIAAVITGIAIGITSSAFAWTGPTASPPNGNVSAPINVGTASQVKNGSIGVNGLAVFGNTLQQAGSYLDWGTVSGTSGYGIRDNAGVLEFKNSGGAWQSLQATIYNYCTGGACGSASTAWANITGKPGNLTYWDTWYGSAYLGSNGDLYMGWDGRWLSQTINQDVRSYSNPNFNNVYVDSRGMWMSETARQDGGRFSVYGYSYYAVCPSGSVLVGGAFDGSNPWADCQWIN